MDRRFRRRRRRNVVQLLFLPIYICLCVSKYHLRSIYHSATGKTSTLCCLLFVHVAPNFGHAIEIKGKNLFPLAMATIFKRKKQLSPGFAIFVVFDSPAMTKPGASLTETIKSRGTFRSRFFISTTYSKATPTCTNSGTRVEMFKISTRRPVVLPLRGNKAAFFVVLCVTSSRYHETPLTFFSVTT